MNGEGISIDVICVYIFMLRHVQAGGSCAAGLCGVLK